MSSVKSTPPYAQMRKSPSGGVMEAAINNNKGYLVPVMQVGDEKGLVGGYKGEGGYGSTSSTAPLVV